MECKHEWKMIEETDYGEMDYSSYGEGVERVFPVHSPYVAKIAVERSGKVRRAKLYYMRNRTTKQSRLKEI